jgi:hypothetical protein
VILDLSSGDLADADYNGLASHDIGFEHLSSAAKQAVRANGSGRFSRGREACHTIYAPPGDGTPCAIGDLRLGGNTSKAGCMATICAVIGEDEYQHLRVTRAQLQGLGQSIALFLSYTEPEASE